MKNDITNIIAGEDLVQCVPTKKGHQILYKVGPPDWISIYFTKQSDVEHKCNICEVTLTTDSKYTELVDHTKNLHKEVYDLHKDNTEPGYQIEFLQFSMLKYDDNKTQPVILEEICETESEVIKDDATPAKDIGIQYILLPDINKSEESSRKRSWVWKYFDKLTNTIFRCNLCNVVLSIKGCNTNNMNRHIRTRHPVVYNSEVELKTHEKNEKESDLDLHAARQRRSWVWAYFKRVSNTHASCKICNRNICHGGNATGNMNRHLKMIHHKTGACNYWIWKVFENFDDDFFSCKICQYKCMKIDDVEKCVQTILDHLKTVHGLISGDQIITGAEYEVENE